MVNIKKEFANLYNSFSYLSIKELIENFAVFGGCDTNILKLDENIYENIKHNIIDNYHTLKKSFSTNKDINSILKKIALGDRKQYAIYRNLKNISQNKGRILHKELFEKNMIEKELTRETIPKREKNRFIKKEFRGYVPENKLRFVKNFDRFWYTFIYPFSKDLDNDIKENCLKNIHYSFDRFVSLTFEELSNELIKENYLKLNIIQSGGYWDINTEYDLLAQSKDGGFILGECKWTNQKICKNTLRKLKNKAKYLNFEIEKYALFSKNGFSVSLKKEKDILLFDLEDFKWLLKDSDDR